MNKMNSLLLSVIIASFFLMPGIGFCADGQKITTDKKVQPSIKSMQVPATKAVDIKKDNKIPTTGVGKREIVNADFKIEGINGNTADIKDNSDKIVTLEKDSVIIISGWMELGDMEYNSADPEFPMPHIVFADAPQTCHITKGGFPQLKHYGERYKYRFTFEDTATKSECWYYFMKLDKVSMNVQKIKVRINSPWEAGQEMNIVDGGIKEFQLSPVKSKNPGGD